jgi:hypothetical protein
MRLSPGRQSHVPSTIDVQDGLGALVVSLFRPLQAAQPSRSASVGRNDRPTCCEGDQVSSVRFLTRRIAVRTLGFNQSRLHPAIRVLPCPRLDGFGVSRLSEHATFPVGFRRKASLRQVSPVTQERRTHLLPCYTGINRGVTRRSVASLQPAQPPGIAPQCTHWCDTRSPL